MNKQSYTHLLATFGRRPGYWIGFVCEIVRTLLMRIWGTIIMAQIATSISSGNMSAAKSQALLCAAVHAAGAIIGTVGELVAIRSENKEYGRMLLAYYQKLTNKDMAFYRDNQTGYLASLFRQYLDSAMILVRFIRHNVSPMIVTLVVPTIILLSIDWKVGLVAVVILITQVIYVFWSSSKANTYRLKSHEIYRKVTGEVSDEVTNILAFKSGGIEREARGKVSRLADEEIETFWLRRKTTTLLDLPRSLLTGVGVSAALFFVVEGAESNPASVGLIVLTLIYMFQIIRSIAELPNLIVQHDDLITKLYPTLKYLSDDYEAIRDPVGPKELAITEGAISIRNVDFSYPDHSETGTKIPVFQKLTITINGGEQVGIVGLSGAGKSTLASLLMRFDEVDDGEILIDGINIRDVRQSDLRRNIAYVPQEPLLFHRTVKENIAYFNESAGMPEIILAAQAAHAHEFISKLPHGYDTIVGERGVKLSGGQKQRIVIARAVLKRAPIMIFDEATSALDSESEQIIQRALPQILDTQTAIVIAHRLSTVANLDKIIVMHDGQIIEQGTHSELLQLQGRYHSLWQKQTNGD
jgi:ATP-binding cassette subfamily B protein